MRILEKLSPLTEADDPYGWAQNWRERCTAYAKRPKDELSMLPLHAMIQLHNPDRTVLTVERSQRTGRRKYVGLGVYASAQCIKAWGYDVLKDD